MSRSNTLSAKNQPVTFVPWVVFAASFGCTVFAWWVVGKLADQRDEKSFAQISSRIQGNIEDRLDLETNLGKSLAAFMGATPNATEKEFNQFLARSGWPGSSHGVGAISFIASVPPHGIPAFLQLAKASGVANVRVDPSLNGKGGDFVLFRRPEEKGMKPRGFDLASDPIRKEALERARDLGTTEATGVTSLLQDKLNPKPAIVMFTPVYSTDKAPPPGDARKKFIRGYIGMGVRLGELLLPGFTGRNRSREASFTIHAGPADDPKNIVFQDRPQNFPSRFTHVEEYASISGAWTTVFRSLPNGSDSSDDDFTITILVGGFIFSVVLFLLTAKQARSHREVAGYAREIERRAACESLLVRAGNLLSNAEDYEATLKDIGRIAVPSFSDGCAVDVLKDGEIVRLAFFHDSAKTQLAETSIHAMFPPALADSYGVGKALKTGSSELLDLKNPELAKSFGMSDEVAEFIITHDFRSMMIVPINVLGQPSATLTFIVGGNRQSYTMGDLRQAEEVAQRISLAIENRRLFQSAQSELQNKQAAENALKKLNDQLEGLVNERTRELSVAVEELEAFCYSVSHDLRAPLRSVDGFSKALLEDYEQQIDEDGVDYLVRIRGAAKRMDELITAMLSLSRLTRAEISPVNVNVSEIASEIAEEARRENQVEIVVQPNMVGRADPHMLRILIENLVINAVKFSGRVENPKVEIGERDGVFFVKDNGAGFDPRYSSKLFQPFERLHTASEFPGTGIGLATVSRVVKRHGGKIWAESTPGNGATFYFTLALPIFKEDTFEI